MLDFPLGNSAPDLETPPVLDRRAHLLRPLPPVPDIWIAARLHRIIRRGPTFLVIQRNDGRGFSLPGGISGRNEAEIDTLHREVLEETGLRVTGEELRMRFHSTAEVPCHVSVFEVEASGELKDSWEGSPRWMTLPELEPRLLESQRPVLDLLRKISAESSPGR